MNFKFTHVRIFCGCMSLMLSALEVGSAAAANAQAQSIAGGTSLAISAAWAIAGAIFFHGIQ